MPLLLAIRYDGQNHVISKGEKQRWGQLKKFDKKPLTFCIKYNITLCPGCFPNYHKKV